MDTILTIEDRERIGTNLMAIDWAINTLETANVKERRNIAENVRVYAGTIRRIIQSAAREHSAPTVDDVAESQRYPAPTVRLEH